MKTYKWWLMALLLTGLAACGGGGSETGDPAFSNSGQGSGTGGTGSSNVVTGTPTLTISVSSASVSTATPATVTVKLVDGQSRAVVGTVVTFSTEGKKGLVSPDAGLTDSNGQVTATLMPATNVATADSVVASATVNGQAVSAKIGFSTQPTSVSLTGLTSAAAQLSAYGQTLLTLSSTGASTSVPTTVELTSPCVVAGKASISPAVLVVTSASASVTYKDNGCGLSGGTAQATDVIRASISGSTSAVTTSQVVLAPSLGGVEFVPEQSTATPIYLKGSGLTTTASVAFKLTDSAGNGVAGQSLAFSLTTNAGGLTLNQTTGTTDATGVAIVNVLSGTVPTPVRVLARHTLPSGQVMEAVSNQLTVAVGLPTQNNYSMSTSDFALEGMNYDGETAELTVIASDRLGNPVPDDTVVNFVASNGQVLSSAKFANGQAKTTYVSSGVRPDQGRVTVLAYTVGEESFVDANNNNVWDAGEAWTELGDPYLDKNWNASFDGQDQSIPYDPSVVANCAGGSSLYAPSRVNTCDGRWGKQYVRAALQLVLSTSGARPLWVANQAPPIESAPNTVALLTDASTNLTTFNLVSGAVVKSPTAAPNAATFTVSMLAADTNSLRLNPLPKGTTITVTPPTGMSVTAIPSTVPDGTTPGVITLRHSISANSVVNGEVIVTFTTPNQQTSTVSYRVYNNY